jgi:Tfp pilus assembly protein PilP
MTTDELKKRRAELGTKVKNARGQKKQVKEEVADAPKQGESNLVSGFAAGDEEFNYDSRSTRDPFRSFLLAAKAKEAEENAGPLADYELGQLSVLAIVWDSNNPRALVQDPRGQTHILGEGSPVGKNRGRVIHIGDNLVLVKETYVDYAGVESTNDVELRIRGSQGG